MPSSEKTPQNEPQDHVEHDAAATDTPASPTETAADDSSGKASAAKEQLDVAALDPPAESGGATSEAPADRSEVASAGEASDTEAEPAADAALASEAAPQKTMPTGQQIWLEESGRGLWLTLLIGAAGLLLTLLLPWVNVYYLNPLQPLVLGDNQSVTLTRDEVVHVVLQGYELLSFTLWPLLGLFFLTALLFGATIYWRQTKFAQVKIAWLTLALGLIVGIGFPVELRQLLVTSQDITWKNDHATIEDNNHLRTFQPDNLYLCTPNDQNDHSCDPYYAHGVVINAGIDWKQTTVNQQQKLVVLVQGHADSVRAAYNSPNVATSGKASGSFGDMGVSFGYWGSWVFSLWTLLNALLLLRRLARKPK